MAILYIMTGLPYAGKTTLRKELVKRFGFSVVSVDEINSERGVGKNERLITQDDWDKTYSEAYKRLKSLLASGKTVIFDGANLPFHERETARLIAKDFGVKSKLIFVDTPLQEIKKRRDKNEKSKKRGHVNDSDFKVAIKIFDKPRKDEEPIVYNTKMNLEEWMKRLIFKDHRIC